MARATTTTTRAPALARIAPRASSRGAARRFAAARRFGGDETNRRALDARGAPGGADAAADDALDALELLGRAAERARATARRRATARARRWCAWWASDRATRGC